MKIHLLRHLKVDFNWGNYYDSVGFDEARRTYNQNPIIISLPVDISNLDFETVYMSELTRTQETFDSLKLDTIPIKTALLNEVRVRSYKDTKKQLPTALWKIRGILQWYTGNKRQIETRKDTIIRIKAFVELIEKDNKNKLIIGHGFFFSQLVSYLRKNGYKGRNKRIFKNGDVLTLEK